MSRKSTQFNCFSPPVMVATLVTESVLALYTLFRYKFNTLGRLAAASLLALATFQLCEYHVCVGSGTASDWSRAGYVAITLLPALGLHMLHVLADKKGRKLVLVSYASMVAFAGYFLLGPRVFQNYACTGNYVIFHISSQASLVYSVYYYGWLLTAIVLGLWWATKLKAQGTKAYKRVVALQGLVLGYLVFLVPTAVANTIKPETRAGIPSIMCGFAVLYALILTLHIMPQLGVKRTERALTTKK